MYTLIKNTLTSKDFYKNKYKKITRTKTLIYLLIISLLFSLILTPLSTYITYNKYLTLKSEVNKIPPALKVTIKNGKLETNFNKPLIFNLSKNSVLVIDPKNSFTDFNLGVDYYVYREKGLVIYTKNNIANEVYGNALNISLASKSIIELFNSVPNEEVLSILFFLIFIYTGITSFISALALSFIFALVLFFVKKFFVATNITLGQTTKLFVFLFPYYFLGSFISILFFGSINTLPTIFLIGAYLFLVPNK